MEKSEDKAMTFGEHLEELRKRLIRSALAFVVIFIICIFIQDYLMDIAVAPHLKVISWLKKEGIKAPQEFMGMSYTSPFMQYMKLILLFSIFFSSPFIAYQLWMFVKAGLYKKERHFILTFAPLSFALFILGCMVGYFILIPYGLYFLAKFADPSIVLPQYAFSDYLSLVTTLTVIMGIVFQLPLVMTFVSRIGLVEPKTFSKWRRFAIVAIFITAAILTPGPDIFSQCMMAIPLWLLYEIGIILAKLSYKKKTY